VGYLTDWNDPGMEVGKEAPKELAEQECVRLARQLAIVTAAGEIPRRIGADASAEELALDKRRSKRVAHVLRQNLTAWSGKKTANLPSGGEIQREAAILDWEKWAAEHQAWLLNRTRYIVTLCFKNNGDEKFAKGAVVKLTNETNWLKYALRD
jgi:hypothetical protein